MKGRPSLKKNWELTPEAFDGLLLSLSPDGERAAEKYESVRRRLITFFEARGCSYPEDYADETINRAARRINEGAHIHTDDPASYFYGIARNLIQEYWEEGAKRFVSVHELSPSEFPQEDPHEINERRAMQLQLEREVQCLELCMEGLTVSNRQLIIKYYEGETSVKIKNRKLLAEELSISFNALRIRALRIRERLEVCLDNCLEQPSGA